MNHFVPDFDTDDDYVHANPNSMNLPRKSIMGEEDDDLMELLWHNGQVVIQNQRPKKPHGGGGAAPMHQQQQPLDQNLFIQEDEMSSWLQYPLRDDDFCSDLLFSGVASASASHPQSVSRAVTPPSAAAASERQTMSQVTAASPPLPSSVKPPVPSSVRPLVPSSVRPPVPSSARPPVRNFMNFSRLRGDFTGGSGRVEPGPSISKPIVRESTLVNPSATPSSAASESGLTQQTVGIDSRETLNCGSISAVAGGGAYAFAVPGHNRKGKALAAPESEIPGTSSYVVSKTEIEPVYVQQETKKTIVDDRKRKEREAIDETECRSEETTQGRGATSTKRSRAAEVHNLSERKRRDRINERMKALQELVPRCNKSDKASMLDEAIEYMKSLQLQVQMLSMGGGMMPMMYPGMQQYMAMGMGMNQPPPPSFMTFPNMLAAQRPLPIQHTHLDGSVFPGPHYPVHASDPSRVYLPNQQPDPTSNQPQYPGYMDPYQQFRALQPTQHSQAISYPSSSRVSSSKDSEEQGNHTAG